MSRIGKKPVQIPDKVKVAISGTTVSVEGPKGKVSKTFAPVVKIEQQDKTLVVSKTEETRFSRAMYGTARSVIASMVQGVSVGYAKELEIQGVGFKAALKGKQLDLALGYSHPIIHHIPDGKLQDRQQIAGSVGIAVIRAHLAKRLVHLQILFGEMPGIRLVSALGIDFSKPKLNGPIAILLPRLFCDYGTGPCPYHRDGHPSPRLREDLRHSNFFS